MDAVGLGIEASAKYECLLFDMDDTLYPWSTGLNLACRKNIEEYMLHNLKIEESEVPRMCLELYLEYGTTMAGLKVIGYDFDDDEFHSYVHGRLPYDKLKPDPTLKNLLLSMPQRKIVFTNADKKHAIQVLNILGLDDCFDGIICFETLNPPKADVTEHEAQDENKEALEPASSSNPLILCKPSLKAFEAALHIADIDPAKTMFFDDSSRNIASAKQMGLHTVIVGSSVQASGADYALSSIHNIKEAIPEIWEGKRGEQLEQAFQSASFETFVTA